MASNRPTTRRRSTKHPFEDDDAPAAKRAKTEVNGTGRETNGATKRTAKAAYEEEAEGFQFSRRTSRRTTTKARAAPAPEPIPEEPAKSAPSRRKKLPVAEDENNAPDAQKRRRSARLSGDREHHEGPTEPNPLPKRTKKTAPGEKKTRSTPAPDPEEKNAPLGVRTPVHNELHVAKNCDGGATKIMLPFADTPVILRNKEMRRGNKDGRRRSSTGLRGRRASSLIDSGLSNALPHSEVEVREFYKHIEQSLPEPRRMKQLLTWCGARALPEKPSGHVPDTSAIMAARAIQQELIDDFANKPELSDWFSREDTAPVTVVKKPNPVNILNQSKLQEVEEELKRLEEEKAIWEALSSTSKALPPSPPVINTSHPSLSDIDASLLDPSQASIFSALQPQISASSSTDTPHPPSSQFSFTFTTPSALQTHLSHLASSLEPNIDLLADGVHKIEQYRNTAERVADRVLGTAAQRLEERDREGKEKAGSEGIGVGDVLRGLAGVLGEG
ncbi:kinetochore protein Mis13 [Clohesyomyces aquaticus]|uniref:Kinetochore protein Mis13 n=1 Tax=Clohesyomyces aquaticus TaxID=1231657 RepID=A0A1Y2AAE8_9PLEO|nr:kinetochore protein Mis13 [Clohesyomyces aquaticus]